MVRYGVFVFMSLVMMVYILWYMFRFGGYLTSLVILLQDLFHKSVDPTLLDSRVSYSCTAPWTYTLSTQPSDVEALAFYSKKWSPTLFNRTLDQSLEIICLTYECFSFA